MVWATGHYYFGVVFGIWGRAAGIKREGTDCLVKLTGGFGNC